jgi:ribosomal protein S27E
VKHSLNILENAIDSLTESLEKYKQGESGDYKSYKFSILHLSHFLELLFKYYISEKHELFIYKNPFAANLDRTSTITFWDAVNFISHDTGELKQNSQFRKDLDWLKKVRNDIEHYKFEFDVSEVRTIIGRIFTSVVEFLEFFSDLSLENHVSEDLIYTFKILSDDYEKQRYEALRLADEAEEAAFAGVKPKYQEFVEFQRFECPECGNSTMIPHELSSSGYKCTFCGNEESYEIPVTCDCCGTQATEDEIEQWIMDDGSVENRCYYCSGRYEADKDE